jgi:hypothetical protein
LIRSNDIVPISNEEILEAIRNFSALETERFKIKMTSNQDVMNAITALPISALTAALTQLNTTVNTAISDMGTGGDAARAGFVAALTTAGTQLGTVATQINTIETELTAAVAAAISPPATPATPVVPVA